LFFIFVVKFVAIKADEKSAFALAYNDGSTNVEGTILTIAAARH
jgi:hypothetical protein